MRIAGALAAGVFAFFAVALATGRVPRMRFGLTSSGPKPDVSNRQIWLRQAGLDLTPLQYYLGLGAVGAIAFAVVSAITSTPTAALVPAAIAVVVPHVFFSRRRDKNVTRTQKVWPDAIREVIASIESNASLHGALAQLAYKGPEPMREAFERFPMLATTVGVVPALEAVRERLADPTSDRVIEVLILAHERGGGIVTDILRDLARATSEDLQLDEEIVTTQLEQKINSRAVFVIPWGVLVMLVMSNHNFKAFYQTAIGFAVVLVGAAFSLCGMLIMARLARSTPEPRVFGGSALSSGHEEANV